MKSIITTLIALGFSGSAFSFVVFNQTSVCAEVKDYSHIFNRYNEHILSNQFGVCDPSSSRCQGQLDFRVIEHSDASEIQVEEPLCSWKGDVGTGNGYFLITPNPSINPGEKDSCKVTYYR